MTDSDLLSRAIAFDAGPPPLIDRWVVDEDDLAEPPNRHHRMYVAKVRDGWCLLDMTLYVDIATGEREYRPPAKPPFTTAREAFAWLMEWKARERERGLKAGSTRWKDRERA